MYGGRIIDPMMENNGSPEHLVGWVIVVESTQPQLNAHTLAHAHTRAHTLARTHTHACVHSRVYTNSRTHKTHSRSCTHIQVLVYTDPNINARTHTDPRAYTHILLRIRNSKKKYFY